MYFDEFDLNDDILDALYDMGFEKATPIQEQAIPIILDGKDLIACAQTGTGKTAAFSLPILNKLALAPKNGVNTLIIVPTRELAIQIDQQIQGFAYYAGVNSLAVYGGGDGVDFSRQRAALSDNTDVIIATPGKLISHLNMGYVKFDQVQHFILDEADRMLDMGFFEDIQKIASFLPEKRQNLMFSATMPPKIRQLAKNVLRNPEEISIAISKPSENVLQAAYLVHDDQKARLINSLIVDKPVYESIIVFSSTKRKVNHIMRALSGHGYNVEGISSDLEQKEREDVLLRFRSKKTRVLVATDVISRGIDIKDINIVINFDVPNDAEDYVHRVGRTARADSTGVALTLITEDEMLKFSKIEQLIEREIHKIPLPEEFGEAPVWNPKPPKKHYKKKFNPKKKKHSSSKK